MDENIAAADPGSPHDPDHAPAPAAGTAPAATPRSATGLRGRVLGWRGVAAVALASVVLGGAGGAVLGAVSNGGDSGGPGGRMGGPGGLQGNHQRMPMGGVPGQLPPSTAPQQGQPG